MTYTYDWLAYLALRTIITKERKTGVINTELKNLDIEFKTEDAKAVGQFIKEQGYGNVISISLGRVQVTANMAAENYVLQIENQTLDEKARRIMEVLQLSSGRNGKLEEILKHLKMNFQYEDLVDYIDWFEQHGFVRITAQSKDSYEIHLTQTGIDYLNGKVNVTNNTSSGITIIANNSQIGSIGNESVVSQNSFTQNLGGNNISINFEKIVPEIALLIKSLRSEANTPEQFESLAALAVAEQGAKERDGNKVFNGLKKVGSWVLRRAQEVGASYLANYIAEII